MQNPGDIIIPVIVSNEQLTDFLSEIKASAWVAVDTEADSLHSYPEKLCLMQISLPGRDVLLDPLSGMDMNILWPVIQGRELILHGADYDLRLLKQTQGFVPSTIFDTMLAARILGYHSFGLGNLVSRHLSVTLEKSSQKADWSRRPLTPKMEAYARNDTHFLRSLEEILRAELMAKGRLEWHRELCQRMITDNTQNITPDPNLVWRVKGSSHLSRSAMAVLREIWLWRDTEARTSGRPPFFILPHEALVNIAHAAVSGEPIEGFLPRRFYGTRRTSLEQAIHQGLQLPPDQHPEHLHRETRRMHDKHWRAFCALQERRDKHATALKIDPSLIASKATLTELALDSTLARKDLMQWQDQLLFG